MTTQLQPQTSIAMSEPQQLLDMLLQFSPAELGNLRRLLQAAERHKRNGNQEHQSLKAPRRFIDPEDNGPVWELGFTDTFDRASCYARSEEGE